MRKKTFFLVGLTLLLASCKKDDEGLPSLPTPECHGSSMVGIWSIKDSLQTIYLDFDSTVFAVYYREMTLYETGNGNLDFPWTNDDYFFTWILQCDPDLFTISAPFNSSDSLFSPQELYSVAPYEILINELNYKRLKRERNVSQLNKKEIVISDMTKKE